MLQALARNLARNLPGEVAREIEPEIEMPREVPLLHLRVSARRRLWIGYPYP